MLIDPSTGKLIDIVQFNYYYELESVKAQKNIIKHLRMDSDFESKFHKEAEMMSEATKEKGITMSIQGKAENYFSTYAKMYDEIV